MPEVERYTLFLNPYAEQRFPRCPRCGERTHKRNRVLIVQSGPDFVAPVMATCRYCTNCDLLIAHQDELEATLRQMLTPEGQAAMGDEMSVVGTLDRSQLSEGIESVTPNDLVDAFHPIADYVHFDPVEDEAGNIEWVEVEQPYPSMMSDIPVPEIAEVQALPQVNETWEVAVRTLPTWVFDDDTEPYRPHGILVVNRGRSLVIFNDMIQRKPSVAEVRDALLKAMSHPTSGAGEPRRPAVVVVDDQALTEPLRFELNAFDIRCKAGSTPEVDAAWAELETYLAGGREPIPGLLDNPRVTPEQVGDLFEAAAEFYDVMPWEWMLDEDMIAVRYPVPDGQWRFASVMGYAGMEFGLAVFEDISDYDILATALPEDTIGMMAYRSLTFDDIMTMPFGDVEALERYGWDVAADDAYPIPAIFTKQEEVKRPGPEEIDWYTVALRAIVDFFYEYWPDDVDYVPEPVSTTFVVPLGDEDVEVEVRYPAELALEEG
ncbi:MAG: hypothetical protein MAG451_02055 [Anaerolineales bacterium]|nr:hypothetical protein [Anaerolineales bacterium]